MGEQRDLEGVSALVTGAPTGVIRASGSWLRDQRVVMLGASSAAIGVADMMRRQMAAGGVPDTEAYHRFHRRHEWPAHRHRSDLSAEQRSYAQPAGALAGRTRTSKRRGAGGSPLMSRLSAAPPRSSRS